MLPLLLFSQLNGIAADLCEKISPQTLQLCDAFKITDEMISAPIALDWVDYNVCDNEGEV